MDDKDSRQRTRYVCIGKLVGLLSCGYVTPRIGRRECTYCHAPVMEEQAALDYFKENAHEPTPPPTKDRRRD